MKEKHLHKFIRNKNMNDNTLLADALKAQYPELTTAATPDNNRRNRTYKRLTAVFTTLSAAQALALILIPTLLLSGGKSSLPTDGGGTKPPSGVWDSNTQSVYYISTKMGYSIEEYNQVHNTNFLFFDAVQYDYNIHEYRSLTDEYLCLQVEFICDDNDERIGYAVYTKDAPSDIVSYDISVCTNTNVISDCTVKWGATDGGSVCGIFDYDGYDYYINVSGNSTKLFELVQELLEDRR